MWIYFKSQLIICTLKLQYKEIISPWIALGWINTIFTVLPHGCKRCMVRKKGRTNLCKRLWRGEKIAGHKLLLPQSLWSSPSGCPLTWEERVTTERIQGLFLTKQFPWTLHGSREQCPYIAWQERHFNCYPWNPYFCYPQDLSESSLAFSSIPAPSSSQKPGRVGPACCWPCRGGGRRLFLFTLAIPRVICVIVWLIGSTEQPPTLQFTMPTYSYFIQWGI